MHGSGKAQSLWTVGNVEVLRRPAVGICGSRDATDAGLKYAAEFGKIAAEAGFVVVSGYARGVDTAAHIGALEAGGSTIAVLPEGIQGFRIRRQLRNLVTENNLLAVSPFEPGAPWTTWNAMSRNKTIIDLAVALFVIEAGESGGTLEAGLECLRRGKPLCVLEYKSSSTQPAGNKKLLAKAAIAIRTRRELKQLLTRLQSGDVVHSTHHQLRLGDAAETADHHA